MHIKSRTEQDKSRKSGTFTFWHHMEPKRMVRVTPFYYVWQTLLKYGVYLMDILQR